MGAKTIIHSISPKVGASGSFYSSVGEFRTRSDTTAEKGKMFADNVWNDTMEILKKHVPNVEFYAWKWINGEVTCKLNCILEINLITFTRLLILIIFIIYYLLKIYLFIYLFICLFIYLFIYFSLLFTIIYYLLYLFNLFLYFHYYI